MNISMAGIVFAGLTAVYKVRLFTIPPTSVWAWVVIFFLDDFAYYPGGARAGYPCNAWATWAQRERRDR